ncbi:hypothetical protein NIES4102_04440 [Chondrocystis sp. NIES-4102]|nr:hypothetical protein NIES4102_04440 [Chondrocystis sp. NIES-4102]
MDKFQAAFKILYLLSSIDGVVEDAQINIIINCFNNIDNLPYFDSLTVINSLNTLTSTDILEEFNHAAIKFKNSSNAIERNNLLQFAKELVTADNYISDREKELLYAIADVWNIDFNEFLNTIN